MAHVRMGVCVHVSISIRWEVSVLGKQYLQQGQETFLSFTFWAHACKKYSCVAI